jgi:hypothetical protein
MSFSSIPESVTVSTQMESAFSVESGKMDETTKRWLIVSSALVG